MRIWTIVLALISLNVFAQDYQLPDYGTFLTDLRTEKLRPSSLFRSLDTKTIDLAESVCSNRAHVWTYQLEKKHNIKVGKIFVFFTGRTGMARTEDWWYHVAPVVSSGGKLYVLDAGLPGFINGSQSPERWFKKVVGYSDCRELTANDEALVSNMFWSSRMPRQSTAGVSNCYYRVTPAPYWTPKTVALNLLGRDEFGTPISFERNEFNEYELLSACKEAVSRGLEPGPDRREKLCRRFLKL